MMDILGPKGSVCLQQDFAYWRDRKVIYHWDQAQKWTALRLGWRVTVEPVLRKIRQVRDFVTCRSHKESNDCGEFLYRCLTPYEKKLFALNQKQKLTSVIDLDDNENAKAIRDSILTIAGATISMISTIAFTSGYVSVPVTLTSLCLIIKAAWDWRINSDQMLVSQDDDFMEVQIGRSTLLSKKHNCPKLEWEDAS